MWRNSSKIQNFKYVRLNICTSPLFMDSIASNQWSVEEEESCTFTSEHYRILFFCPLLITKKTSWILVLFPCPKCTTYFIRCRRIHLGRFCLWYQVLFQSVNQFLIMKVHMKSLIPKGAKSTFVTWEKNAFLCASLYTHLWETQYWIYNILFLLVLFGSEMRSKSRR